MVEVPRIVRRLIAAAAGLVALSQAVLLWLSAEQGRPLLSRALLLALWTANFAAVLWLDRRESRRVRR